MPLHQREQNATFLPVTDLLKGRAVMLRLYTQSGWQSLTLVWFRRNYRHLWERTPNARLLCLPITPIYATSPIEKLGIGGRE